MKKKAWLWIAAGALLLAVLFAPVPTGVADDGGTQVYSALTYKIVKRHRSTEDGIYSATRVYWLPDNFKSIDELWDGGGQTPAQPPAGGVHRTVAGQGEGRCGR